MELSKFKNHRNHKYLSWIRRQDCVVSGRLAHVAHHVNLGTNGGKGIKASDYFCVPLLNEFHTTGLWAVHSIGEATFFETFKLNRDDLFINFLKRFLKEEYGVMASVNEDAPMGETIYQLVEKIEKFAPAKNNTKKKALKSKNILKNKVKTKSSDVPRVKISETDYYKKSKELKKQYEKELRDKNKKKLSQYRKEQYQKAKALQKSNQL